MTGRFTWRDYRQLDRRVWVLAAARAVNTGGLSMAMAFMAIYIVNERGLAATLYAGLFLVANLCQSASQAYAGEASDRIGRRGLMLAALVIRSVVVTVLGALVLAEASIWLIGITLMVSGILRGLFEPVAYATVADVATPRERVAAFGIQRMGTNVGWAMGPAAGGALAEIFDYGTIFFFSAGMLLLAALAISSISETRSREGRDHVAVSARQALSEASKNRMLVLLLACAFLGSIVHMQLFTTLSVYSSATLGLDNASVGLVFTVNGACVLLLQVPAVHLIERIGTPRALVVGAIGFAVSFLFIGAASGFATVAAAVAVLTVGEVILAPAQQAVIASVSEPGRVGRAYGLFGFLSMAGVAVGPVFGGVAFDYLGRDGMVMWSALAMLPIALAAGYAIYGRRSQRA